MARVLAQVVPSPCSGQFHSDAAPMVSEHVVVVIIRMFRAATGLPRQCVNRRTKGIIAAQIALGSVDAARSHLLVVGGP